jgi:carbamoyltransferase|tara:strand:- start:764 stop:2521 length:1758 start_codon:yes stop_codon:yes gene_type:complete
MIILGLTLGHDASVSLLKDGKVVSSISCERVYRDKKTSHLDWVAIDYVLSAANTSFENVDYISVGGYDKWSTDGFVKVYLDEEEDNPFNSELPHLGKYGYDILKDNWLVSPTTDRNSLPFINVNVVIEGHYVKKGFLINHQTAHAASTFYTSPFNKSVIMTLDGSGEYPEKSGSYHYGDNDRLEMLGAPNTLIGVFYDKMTDWLSIGPGLTKAGTLMGLSSYGKPNEVAINDWKDFIINNNGNLSLGDIDFYYVMASKLAGLPPHTYRLWLKKENKLFNQKPHNSSPNTILTKSEVDTVKGMDLASSVQYIFEKIVLMFIGELYDMTKDYNQGNLCLAGGSFLNCNVNYKILKESKFKNIYIYPAAGDDGLSTGSVLYAYHHILGNSKNTYSNSEIAYTGKKYSDETIGEEYDVKLIAKMIGESKIIAWYQGSSEFGPRALGNRSFIANPTDPKMKDILNERIKFREWFRPFAPSVTEENCQEYFDIDVPSPFMLYTCPVKKPELLPSITHVDGTARVQTVNQKDNPIYYELIREVEKHTNVPMVLNTSLNVNGQPIVETIKEAINLFNTSDVDAIVINNRMILK